MARWIGRQGGATVLHRPKALYQLEGLAALVVCLALYAKTGQSWLLAIMLFFVPDLSLLAYAFNGSLGTSCYNLAHTYSLPALLATLGILTSQPLPLAIALI